MTNNKPHMHAETIKAWADGAKIQYLHNITGFWCDVGQPAWRIDFQYRVKPEPKPDVVIVRRAVLVESSHGDYFTHQMPKDGNGNVEYIFDGDRKLLSVRMID